MLMPIVHAHLFYLSFFARLLQIASFSGKMNALNEVCLIFMPWWAEPLNHTVTRVLRTHTRCAVSSSKTANSRVFLPTHIIIPHIDGFKHLTLPCAQAQGKVKCLNPCQLVGCLNPL